MTEDSRISRKWKRRILLWVVVISALLFIVALLVPFAVKRYIESNSIEWIDRQVKISSILVNPITFRCSVNGLSVSEPNKKDVFLSWKSVSIRPHLLRGLIYNNWEFDGLRIEEHYVNVYQNRDRFNFSDLIDMFDTGDDTDTSTTQFSVRDVQVINGRIDYSSDLIKTPLHLQAIEARCPEITSSQALMELVFGVDIGGGGRLDAEVMLDTRTNAYGVNAHLNTFDLQALKPYVEEFFECDRFEGLVDIDVNLKDNLDDTTSFAMSAAMDLKDFELTDPNGDLLLRCKSVSANVDTIIAKEQLLKMGDMNVEEAAIRFVLLNDGSDNWTRLVKLESTEVDGDVVASSNASESNIFLLMADYVTALAKYFTTSTYSASSIAVNNASLEFEDHTPAQPFRYDITGIDLYTKSMSSAESSATITGNATLEETGKVEAKIIFDPNNTMNIDIDFKVAENDLSDMDAYSRWYAAHPLKDGIFALESRTRIQNGLLDSQNRIRVDDLVVGKNVDDHDPETIVLPLRLGASLLKDPKGIVYLEVPVTGDLNDPTFKPWPIVLKIMKDLVLKAVSAPGQLLSGLVEDADPEELERLRLDYLQRDLDSKHQKSLGHLALALKNKTEISVAFVSTLDEKAEAEEVGVFQVKRSYLFNDRIDLTAADSLQLLELNNSDSLFRAYVEERTPELSGRTIHERCYLLTGAEVCKATVIELEQARQESMQQTLMAEGLSPDRFSFRLGTESELTGLRGLPGYRFIYSVRDN